MTPDWVRLQLWPEVVLGQPKQAGRGDCWRAGSESEGVRVLGTAVLCLPDPSLICWVSPKAISLHDLPQLGVNCLK